MAEETYVFPIIELFVILNIPEKEWFGSFLEIEALLVVFGTHNQTVKFVIFYNLIEREMCEEDRVLKSAEFASLELRARA